MGGTELLISTSLESGVLKLLEPTDRGFIIKQDLMMRAATQEIPQPSSGLEQISKEKVIAR